MNYKAKMVKNVMTSKYEHIINKLKIAREESGLKQEDVAEELNQYKTYISKIEHGDRKVDVVELIELARIYKKDIDFFIKDLIKRKQKTKSRKRQ